MEAIHYQLLYDITRTLYQQSLDLDRTLHTILSRTQEALATSQICLMTFQNAAHVEHIYVMGENHGAENVGYPLWDTLLKGGIVESVCQSSNPIIIHNMQTDPRWQSLPATSSLPQSGSALGVSLCQSGEMYGAFLLIHPTVDYFTAERIGLIREIADIACSAVANSRRQHLASENDTRYQTLFEHAVVPIILTDIQGIVQKTNFRASELLGYTHIQLRGVHLRDLNMPSVEQFGVDKLKNQEETYFRTQIFDIDGREIPTLIRVRRVHVDDEMLLEWMMQDMSAQMELEQLRHDLTAMVYHDLRGPLTNILAGTMSLSKTLVNHENPAVAKILALSMRSMQQLQRLVDSLLDIQRLEDGKAILNLRTAEIQPMLLDVVQLVLPIAQEAGQVIRLDVAPHAPTILLDTDMITRVIVNLVENAIKYTPNGGDILLQANIEADHLLVTVKDSGPGIPEEARITIFDKFSRVKYQGAPKGVGLGLAFCRLAVEAHHGHIWVDSDGVNGSAFRFSIPLQGTDTQTMPPAPSTTHSA
jgi:PAS domain S-box-containing protein